MEFDPTTTFVTSDLHFGHANILSYTGRPCASVDEMNDWLVELWNGVVKSTDTVVILGDLAMGKRSETLPIVRELNGRKMLIPGNHCHCHPAVTRKPGKLAAARALYESVGLEILPEQVVATAGGKTFLMCHFPYYGDHVDEERFTHLRPVDEGLPLLHGHTHGGGISHPRQYDVGVDCNDYVPIRLDYALGLFA